MATLRLEPPWRETSGHEGEALACSYTPDHTYLLSAGWDGTLRIWEPASGNCAAVLSISNKPLSACAASPDGKLWLAGSMDGLLATWDADARTQKSLFLAHTRPISSLVFSPDGTQMASTSWDRHVNLWQVDSKLEGRTLGSHSDIAAGCCFAPDGKRLLSWSYDGTFCVWDVAQQRQLCQTPAHDDRVTAGAISPDGQWFVSGARNGEFKLWDMKHGQAINAVPLAAEICGCFFLLDGIRVAVVSTAGHVTLHAVPSLGIEDEVATGLVVQAAALSSSGAQLALGGSDGRVYFLAVDGFDSDPLAVTATQSIRMTATLFDRLLGRSRPTFIYQGTCPACRAVFELAKQETTTFCPSCRRTLRICAITEAVEPVLR